METNLDQERKEIIIRNLRKLVNDDKVFDRIKIEEVEGNLNYTIDLRLIYSYSKECSHS